jgi:hypothetical protein
MKFASRYDPQLSFETFQHGKYLETPGLFCSLAAIVSKTAMRDQSVLDPVQLASPGFLRLIRCEQYYLVPI